MLWPEGDQDHSAQVAIPYDGPENDEIFEYARHIKSVLKTAFAEIWDVQEREIRFLTDMTGNDAWMEGATVFNVWHDGDSSVGIDGKSAEVAMYAEDSGVAVSIDGIKGALRKAFSDIWGARRAHVATSAELAALSAPGEDDSAPR
jgi:hypothetical protein